MLSLEAPLRLRKHIHTICRLRDPKTHFLARPHPHSPQPRILEPQPKGAQPFWEGGAGWRRRGLRTPRTEAAGGVQGAARARQGSPGRAPPRTAGRAACLPRRAALIARFSSLLCLPWVYCKGVKFSDPSRDPDRSCLWRGRPPTPRAMDLLNRNRLVIVSPRRTPPKACGGPARRGFYTFRSFCKDGGGGEDEDEDRGKKRRQGRQRDPRRQGPGETKGDREKTEPRSTSQGGPREINKRN